MTPFERTHVSDYDALITAFRDRLNEMQINHRDFGKLAGLSDGLIGKLVGDARTKTIGFQSLWFVLDALALRFELVSDPEMLAANEQRYEKCVTNKRVLDREAKIGASTIKRAARAMGKKGGKARQAMRGVRFSKHQHSIGGLTRASVLSPARRAEIAVKAARARWERIKTLQRTVQQSTQQGA